MKRETCWIGIWMLIGLFMPLAAADQIRIHMQRREYLRAGKKS